MAEQYMTGASDPVGRTIRRLSRSLMRNEFIIASEKTDLRMPLSHGWILGFLYDNRDREICQKDIENRFSLAKSTVTGIVKQMEQNGYIERNSMERDNRLKCLTLTKEGEKLHLAVMESFAEVEKKITEGISQEEIETFLAVSGKFMDNLKNCADRKEGTL